MVSEFVVCLPKQPPKLLLVAAIAITRNRSLKNWNLHLCGKLWGFDISINKCSSWGWSCVVIKLIFTPHYPPRPTPQHCSLPPVSFSVNVDWNVINWICTRPTVLQKHQKCLPLRGIPFKVQNHDQGRCRWPNQLDISEIKRLFKYILDCDS